MGDDGSSSQIPESLKGLRACMVCQLVKSFEQFYNDGCENCSFLEMKDQSEHVNDFTSSHYEGLIAMMQPQQSWVAKYQRLVSSIPGMYAIDIFEDMPTYLLEFLKQHKIPFHKTTGSGGRTAQTSMINPSEEG